MRLHDGDARELVQWLPDACLSRVFILFPDPWPKMRHRKRRLVSPEMLRRLARIMRPGAELRFASDIASYVRAALVAARGSDALDWRAQSAQDWRARGDDWPETRYEQKAVRRRSKSCAYLSFRFVRAAAMN